MYLQRREFLQLLGWAAAAGLLSGRALRADSGQGLYDIPVFGNARLLHFTDCHGQLEPVYFREPNVNIGVGPSTGRPPNLVGAALLEAAGIEPGGLLAHAFTYLDFTEAARRFGKVGGFAHLSALIRRLREEFGPDRTLTLDGGDTWQGSGTALWTRGADMIGACNRLGVDFMTGHWEFTYPDQEVLEKLETFEGRFLAQNVFLTDEALFEGVSAHDEISGRVFKPYEIRRLGERRVAVVGQAFPYTPIANPQRFVPYWTFGIRDRELQSLVELIREKEQPDAVVLLSHNGMAVDLKLASQVRGVDFILGGHTHDGMPQAVEVRNPGGVTVVTNGGSNGKFVGVLDLELAAGRVRDYRYRLLPVFAELIEPDARMAAYIEQARAPYLDTLSEELAVADELLYRRGNFNGTFDQLICDALREVLDAQISLSPGFRWGTSVLPGQAVTREHVLDQTATTYSETYVRTLSGRELKEILEDVCDNLFHPDPYYRQGGDMVRVGGLDYVCDPTAEMGQRISGLQLDDGSPVEADKQYTVAGWATVNNPASGPAVWEVVYQYLGDRRTVAIDKLNTPKLRNVAGNPGLADYR